MGVLLYLYLGSRGLALCCRSFGTLFPAGRWLVNAIKHDHPIGRWCPHDGCLASWQTRLVAAPFRPGKPIHQQSIPEIVCGKRHYLQHEPCWGGLWQLGDGKLLLHHEDRTGKPKGLSYSMRSLIRCVRLHRVFLQPLTPTFNPWLRQSGTVRGDAICLNRVYWTKCNPKMYNFSRYVVSIAFA